MKTLSGEPARRAFCQNSVFFGPLTLANSWLASQVQVLPRGMHQRRLELRRDVGQFDVLVHFAEARARRARFGVAHALRRPRRDSDPIGPT